jgi:hypothetical protein
VRLAHSHELGPSEEQNAVSERLVIRCHRCGGTFHEGELHDAQRVVYQDATTRRGRIVSRRLCVPCSRAARKNRTYDAYITYYGRHGDIRHQPMERQGRFIIGPNLTEEMRARLNSDPGAVEWHRLQREAQEEFLGYPTAWERLDMIGGEP